MELAAELCDAAQALAAYGERLGRQSQAVRICVVETAPRLLPALPEPIAARAAADLAQRGVELRLGQRVTEAAASHVVLSGGDSLASDITVWAAGIRCDELLGRLDGLECNRLNQLLVTPSLRTTRDENVFAMGDCAAFAPDVDAPPLPPKAQAAQQEARFLTRALRRRLAGRPLRAFRFRDRGSLVTLGERNAVGGIFDRWRGGVVLVEGWLARFSYRVLYRRHLAVLLGFWRTLLAVLGGWIARRVQPRVKLH